MRLLPAVVAAAFCAMASGALAQGDLLPVPSPSPAVGMNTPALSPDGSTICFSYLGDLWTVARAGGTATRLTVHDAHDAFPRWSPDGRWIAFASDRVPSSGLNYDIYLMPSTGGEPRRLTSHTSNDYPMDWYPDGSRILFMGVRDARTWQLYAIDVKSGVVRTVTSDEMPLRYGVVSPDGRRIAYDRSGAIATWWRPRYHGSANADIYVALEGARTPERLTTYDGMDQWPMWSADGRALYYVTDQLSPGTPNVVSVPMPGGRPSLLTHHTHGAVAWPAISRDGRAIVYTHEGALYVAPTSGGDPARVAVLAPSDDKRNNTVRATLTNGATEVEVAPDGKTLAIVARGDIWTLPVKGGDARRLTAQPSNDYDIWWAPSGDRMAFISDRAGNFDVYTVDVKSGEVHTVSSDPNDENMPMWSPNGKSIAFLRSGPQAGLYVASATGDAPPRRVAESEGNNIFGVGINSYAWSPDSQWLAFSRRDSTNTTDVWVVPAAGGASSNVTRYPGSNADPRWTADGRYLVFLSDRDRQGGADVYALPLERQRAEQEDDEKPGGGAQPSPKPAEPGERKPPVVRIDMADIEDRASRLTTLGVGGFDITPDGKTVVGVAPFGGQPDYFAVPVKGGAAQRLTGLSDAVGIPRFSADPSRFHALGPGGILRTAERGPRGWQVSALGFAARTVFDRRAEITQAFNEFWRRLNTGFYDPKHHGADWAAVKRRYEPLLGGVATREEFALFLLCPMVGELNASHSEVGPAPGPGGPDVAELGMTFDESYAGPGLRLTSYLPGGPNDDLGPLVKPGEYVMAIDGEPVAWNEELNGRLLDKAGKTLELEVSATAKREGARKVRLKPITPSASADLIYAEQVRQRRQEVERLSAGRLAYIHIRAMDPPSLRNLERELWGAAQAREGLVLDIRDNGGGNTHDAILAQLGRAPYGYTQPRDGVRSSQPFRRWGRPTVVLINQNSASDAEIFPYGFRALHLGEVIGTRTPGYVISTYSASLQDGTTYRIPMWGFYTLDGKDMEGSGVRPDVAVDQGPGLVAVSDDRQLQVAVRHLLTKLPDTKR